MHRAGFKRQARLALAAASMAMLAGCLPVDSRDAVPQKLADSAQLAGYSRIRIWGDHAGSIPPEQLLAIVRSARSQPNPIRAWIRAMSMP
jgi:hypothetical protein